MTPEDEARVLAMTQEQRKKHFKPLFFKGKITYRTYDFILSLPYSLLQHETSVLSKEGKDTEDVRHISANGETIEEDIQALAKAFGGKVVVDKMSQITKNILSG